MKNRILLKLFLTVLLVLTAVIPLDVKAEDQTDDEQYHLVFCSDLHYDPSKTEDENYINRLDVAFKDLPQNVSYVSLIGDMVGERGGDAPEYYAEYVFDRTKQSFKDLTSDNFSIIWADHDGGIIDENNTYIRMKYGYSSGQIYEGKDDKGKTIFLVYAIGFYHMSRGGETSKNAAKDFKNWIDTISDKTIPIIVLCHVPIQTNRGDNHGASYWNEALNYAATGVAGINGTETDYAIERDVIYLCAHNHTNDRNEYVFNAGSTMSIQIDHGNETFGRPDDESSHNSNDESVAENKETADTDQLFEEPPGPPPGMKADGYISDIYYTSMVPGYLRTSGNAMLMTITKDTITCTKYNNGNIVSDWVEVASWKDEGKTPDTTRQLESPTIAIRRYEYDVYDGDNGVYDESDDNSLIFTFKRTKDDSLSIKNFRNIRVDGNVVDKNSYDVRKGSVIIELHNTYLKTLSEGSHTLQVIYSDGESKIASFVVKKIPEQIIPHYVIPVTGIK